MPLPMYTFEIVFTWVGQSGIQYATIEAPDAYEAKKRFAAMYGDKVNIVTANKK